MRAVPVLVVLVWTYFAFPILTGWSLPPFWAALAALTLQYRGLRRRDRARRHRLGASGPDPRRHRARHVPAQVVVQIVLPQSIVRMLPAFGSVLSITSRTRRSPRSSPCPNT